MQQLSIVHRKTLHDTAGNWEATKVRPRFFSFSPAVAATKVTSARHGHVGEIQRICWETWSPFPLKTMAPRGSKYLESL